MYLLIKKWWFSDIMLVFRGVPSLKTNIAPENRVSKKDSSFPTTRFQGPCCFHWLNEHQTIPNWSNPHNWHGITEYDFEIFWICSKCIICCFKIPSYPEVLKDLKVPAVLESPASRQLCRGECLHRNPAWTRRQWCLHRTSVSLASRRNNLMLFTGRS